MSECGIHLIYFLVFNNIYSSSSSSSIHPHIHLYIEIYICLHRFMDTIAIWNLSLCGVYVRERQYCVCLYASSKLSYLILISSKNSNLQSFGLKWVNWIGKFQSHHQWFCLDAKAQSIPVLNFFSHLSLSLNRLPDRPPSTTLIFASNRFQNNHSILSSSSVIYNM